jgi:predicted GIY-YIG superfamily endonuclease
MSDSKVLEELNTIKTIAVNNGYTEKLIDNLYRRKVSKLARNSIYGSKPSDITSAPWRRFLYLGPLSLGVCKKIPKDKIKVAFYNKQCLRNLISHTKERICVSDKSGVYKLNCQCGAAYIGQTGRKFKERVKEHHSCFKNKDSASLFAKHLLDENHFSDFVPEILHIEKKGHRLDALEQFEILKCVKNKEIIVNEILYPSHSPLLDLPSFHS